jgi:ribA/ribD-fused uncharacterized protein
MNQEEIARIVEAERNAVVTRGNVVLFWGGWASQWYPSTFKLEGIEFNCAEQFMMWSKATFFKDAETAQAILDSKWPRSQKELGRCAGTWDPAWDEPMGSRAAVLRGTMAKFSQNVELRDLLLKTGTRTIGEASPYDAIWGIGCGMDHCDVWDTSTWKGKNYLGLALMQVRSLIRDASC